LRHADFVRGTLNQEAQATQGAEIKFQLFAARSGFFTLRVMPLETRLNFNTSLFDEATTLTVLGVTP